MGVGIEVKSQAEKCSDGWLIMAHGLMRGARTCLLAANGPQIILIQRRFTSSSPRVAWPRVAWRVVACAWLPSAFRLPSSPPLLASSWFVFTPTPHPTSSLCIAICRYFCIPYHRQGLSCFRSVVLLSLLLPLSFFEIDNPYLIPPN